MMLTLQTAIKILLIFTVCIIPVRRLRKAKNYKKAITTYGRLVAVNMKKFMPCLAESYYNYGLFSENKMVFNKAYSLAQHFPQKPVCQKIISALKAEEECD